MPIRRTAPAHSVGIHDDTEGENAMDGDQDGASDALHAWVRAESDGDAAALERLLADDFTGVGPLGFVLTRPEWIDRHATGALRYDSLRLEDLAVREHGDHAVAIARQTGEGAYRGHPVPAALRAGIVTRREPQGWRIAHVHTSFIAGTPGAPPVPGR